MNAMGESVELGSARLEGRFDPLHIRESAARSPAERLELAISWNRTAGRLSKAGQSAHQATSGSDSDGEVDG